MYLVAFDLGAESGRAIVGSLSDARLSMKEVHRFPNQPVNVMAHLYWDILRLFHEVKEGLARAVEHGGKGVASLGIDTWGVDFALLGENDELLGNPYHYRDERTRGMMAEAWNRVSREAIFEQTGIQFMPINSLYQLLAVQRYQPRVLEQAGTWLMIPDLLNFFLTGQKLSEFTVATTSQMYNPRRRGWAVELLQALELPTAMLPPVVEPGTTIGTLLPQIRKELGAGPVVVVAPGCHDTASAVAAVPAEGEDYLYISCGTWSLVGTEVKEPLINADSLAANFTNEGGVGGTFRLLKNVAGLWLVQQCRRAWERVGEDLTYEELTQLASKAPAWKCLVNPDDERFLNPEDMPSALSQYCRETGQAIPETKGELVRCALESLALKYRWVLEKLEGMLGRKLSPIHIVGGGSRNWLLCQFTADCTGRPVLAGPVEATAMGNLLTQAMALGEVASLAQAREIVRQSTPIQVYEPDDQAQESWDHAYERLKALMGSA